MVIYSWELNDLHAMFKISQLPHNKNCAQLIQSSYIHISTSPKQQIFFLSLRIGTFYTVLNSRFQKWNSKLTLSNTISLWLCINFCLVVKIEVG